MGVLNIIQRIIVALIAIPTVVFCIKYQQLIQIITTILSIVGIYELYGLMNRMIQLHDPTSTTFTSSSKKNDDAIIVDNNNKTIEEEELPIPNDSTILKTISFYIDILFTLIFNFIGFTFALIMVNENKLLLILTLFSNWSSDAFALFVGKKFGHFKLYKELSPNKTMEGGIGAILGSTIMSIVIYFFRNYILLFLNIENSINPKIDLLNHLNIYIIYGIYLGILGIIGDLIESYIKRISKIKDSGNFFGAHGGVLDRIDGLLFSFPFIYILNHLFINYYY
ncbi:hypothetical protein ABK040_000286 [Willaertia magna]